MPIANCLAPPPPPPSSVVSTLTPYKAGSAAAANNFLTPTTDPYTAYADNFDLSLLPQDCALPTDNLPPTAYQYTIDTPTTPLTPTTPPEIKIEEHWTCPSVEIKQEQLPSYASPSTQDQQYQPQQQHQPTKSPRLLIPPPTYSQQQIYPSPQSSPAQSESAFPQRQFSGCYESLSSSRSSLYASSPCPSLDAGCIKQELHILPPSPPESNCETPSPHSSCADIKTEPFDADVEALIDLNALLEQPYKYRHHHHHHHHQSQSQPQIQQQQHQQQPSQNHQVLREYLEDTTFQKKHNLKPLALESFFGGLDEVRGDIEPVISLALEHAKREAEETCAKLQISQDPGAWSSKQVHAWLRSTVAQFKLPPIEDLELKFCENGAALVLLSEEEFTRRLPEGGSTLHAQLEVWKMAYSDGYPSGPALAPQQPQASACHVEGVAVTMPPPPPQEMWHVGGDPLPGLDMDVDGDNDSEFEGEALPTTSNANSASGPTPAPGASDASSQANAGRPGPVKRAGAVGGAPGRSGGGGSHIHLWQFLKELLAAPHVNGTAIRWIDRSKGIFKIEDSVRVAKLWGRRKNRPAMNYDKLSRSIRQYYKKGIMKKTERSQRLVYQFCHPYHM